MNAINENPALFGPGDRQDWNTPRDLAECVADFFAQQGIYWLDPCANEGSVLTPHLSVLLPTPERQELFDFACTRGHFLKLEDSRYAYAEQIEREYLLADGLEIDWDEMAGGFYCNPPFGYARGPKGCERWVKKAAACKRADGVMLLPARTETSVFQTDIFPTADALCFWAGRMTFLGAAAPAPFPSVLPYWGSNPAFFKDYFSRFGRVVVQP